MLDWIRGRRGRAAVAAAPTGPAATDAAVRPPATRASPESLAQPFPAGAVRDPWTGLERFPGWRADLEVRSRHREGGERLGLVHLDLEDFAQLNAEFGRMGGEQVMAVVGERLGALPGWRFAGLGGGEFVGVIGHMRNEDHLEQLCRELGRVLSEPIEASGVVVTTAGSVGRALSPSRTDEVDRVLARAEADLRERQALRVAPPRLTEAELVQRLLAQGLDVAYQPVVEVATGDVVGWEALLRGRLPILGAMNPERVVDSAARTGALDTVMRQVAEQALRTVAEAARRLGRPMTLSLNLEPQQLRAESPFLGWLLEAARDLPVRLLLEITERGEGGTWGAEQEAAFAVLAREGVGLAIDDLGSGASRMALLAHGGWEWVKIDRGFLLRGDRGLVMLRHIVGMLHELGLTVLLEGIETEEHLALARGLGITLVQGHFLGRPVPAGDLLTALPA